MMILWIMCVFTSSFVLSHDISRSCSSLVTCFTENVPSNVSIPPHVIIYEVYCNSQNIWCSSGLFDHLNSIAEIEYKVEHFFTKFKENSDFSFYYRFIDSFQESLEQYRTFIDSVGRASNANYSVVGEQKKCMLFDFDELQSDLKQLSQSISDVSNIVDWMLYYYPLCFTLELTIGLLGNTMVILAIIRGHHMWTETNKLVLNLAVGDVLLLIFNVGGYYIAIRWWFLRLSTNVCVFLGFSKQFATGVSVYSMVALSLMRLLAVVATPGNRAFVLMQRYNSVDALVALVWILSACFAVPSVLNVSSTCAIKKSAVERYLNFIFFCFLPLVAITVFSLFTSRLLKKSVKDMPGEMDVNAQHRRRMRERSARIVLALTVLFAITFVPFYTYFLIEDKINSRSINLLHYGIISRVLYPLNSCLNPIALCAASTSFREEFKNYLLECKRPTNSCLNDIQLRKPVDPQLFSAPEASVVVCLQ